MPRLENPRLVGGMQGTLVCKGLDAREAFDSSSSIQSQCGLGVPQISSGGSEVPKHPCGKYPALLAIDDYAAVKAWTMNNRSPTGCLRQYCAFNDRSTVNITLTMIEKCLDYSDTAIVPSQMVVH